LQRDRIAESLYSIAIINRAMAAFPKESYILRAFAASFMVALVIMILAGGLIHVFHYGLPLPPAFMLVLAAVSFILSSAFFEKHEVGSIIGSVMVSVIATAMLCALSGGFLYFATISDRPAEDLVSAMALAMILSMTLLSYLKRSLAEIEGY